jgi:hypothetical protein
MNKLATSAGTTRREILLAAAALPAGAALLSPGAAVAGAHKLIVFNGVYSIAGPGIDVLVFGWAAQTADGWTGSVVDAPASEAKRDFVGTATGTTRVVPKGMANTINGHTDKDGVRATGVCFERVTDGSIDGPMVKLTGVLTHAENPVIFKIGDPMTLEGNAETGEFTYTLRGGGKDNVFKMKGTILLT